MTRYKIIQAGQVLRSPLSRRAVSRGGARGAWLKQQGKPPLFILPPGPHTNLHTLGHKHHRHRHQRMCI